VPPTTIPPTAPSSLAAAFGGTGSGSSSFAQFFSQPGGLGPWVQGVGRFLAVGVAVAGLLLVARNVARGRGAAAFKDLIGALVAAAVLSDLSLLGAATDVTVHGVGLLIGTLTSL
jgi:hypothetical protein